MPGIRRFTHFQIGKESTAGTAVAATREMYPDGSGMIEIDRMRSLHEDANRGTNSNITHATQMGVMVNIPFRTATNTGVAWDELPYYFCAIDGGVTGVGAQADKTWTYAPTQTSQDTTRESFTIEVGDDTQNFEVSYCQASRIHLAAARGGITQGEIDYFGRTSTKSTVTAVAANNAVKIPAYLWTVKFATAQSGLAGASISTNFLRSFDLDIDTMLRPQFYLDGNAHFGQSVPSEPLGGTLGMVVDSTATAISQFYDKAAADTVDFVQLIATGGTLGSSNYSATITMAVLYDDPEVISGDVDGVNTYSVNAHIAYDTTWGNSIGAVVVNAIAAL